jgi:ubiquitin-like modifier-activating enzyme ATG7
LWKIWANQLPGQSTPKNFYRAEGYIRNFNTVEEFVNVDRAQHLERVGRTIWDAICDGTIYSCPSLLCSFSAICYADLKKYRFTYHFTYPALVSEPAWKVYTKDDSPEALSTKLDSKETTTLVDAVQTWRYSVDARQHGFFLAKRLRKTVLEEAWRAGTGEVEEDECEEGNLSSKPSPRKARSSSLSELGFLWMIGSLEDFEKGFFNNASPADRYVCFADASTYAENPAWMCRNLLVLVRQRWHLDSLQLMCYRDTHARREVPTSIIFQIRSAEPVHGSAEQQALNMPSGASSNALLPGQVDAAGELIVQAPKPAENAEKIPPKVPRITGWERTSDGKMRHRTIDLASQMDPKRLADQAVDLNLKLIKWRISPSIDLDVIKNTSCLLIGAGTLGSYVARNLMGWGVRKITFVDNGSVSYSNPVRQPLYTFNDCTTGAPKATRAKEALKEIYPNVDAEAAIFTVPMAGHPIIGDESKTRAAFDELRSLIDKHDAIFLLMDSRESRWLPTVMAKSAGKLVINAALGFDTYMVMRHGLRPELSSSTQTSPPPTTSDTAPAELACYFCSDVVAPADSLKNATLDQQCTVTRPGAAPIASALAVELLVSVTQHCLRGRAPAPAPPPSTAIAPAPPIDPSLPDSHPLGTVPHQIRGYMSTWQTIQTRATAYDHCAACSPAVLSAYERDQWDFVKAALNEKGFVERVSGLEAVQKAADEAAERMEREMEEMTLEDDEEGEML